MSNETKNDKSPLDELSPEQQARLAALEAEVGFDKITVSFSIEDRNASGQKRSAFYSTTVSKQDSRSPGWSKEEAQVISAMASKHVVAMTFMDARIRQVIGPDEATDQMKEILNGYNRYLLSLAKKL